MTDFLSHLVTRSLHPETSLQPRPVSRFEQGIDPVPAPIEPPPAEERIETRTAPPPAKPLPLPISPRAEIPPPADPRPFPQQIISTQILIPPARPVEPTPIPHRGRLDIPERVETHLQTHTTQERIIERSTLSVPVPSSIQSTSPTHLAQKEPLPSVTNPAAALVPPKPQVPPRITPVLRPMPVIIPPRSASESAPTIHVTIGRVEVRATPSTPTAAPRPPKPSPIMTLDEYLQRKKGGEA